ncbi:amidase [Rhizobium sp. SL86]|uniref:amidase n=1 Tax=Rhizobium sp. SL86 TaxID=2995148 RepID=UPI0022758F8E|nr:amidase [Rhizobium sp. SL86]MCY1667786.1 amidase [Rhizobium sp. SL86]
MTEITSVPRSAAAIAAAVRAGDIAPGAATIAAHRAIAATNATINAVIDHDPALSDPQVDALARRLAAGEQPPLAGVPVLVKDHFRVKGWKATQGSRLFAGFVAEDDDLIVTRLRQAGAIIIGRSNMSEFGCKGVTTNLLYGPTRHPLNPNLTTGGSSGGAAAALAAGYVPIALGSDGGGSARRPAAHAGVVGFKPSGGVVASERELSQVGVAGPMGRTVEDARLLFEAIRGYDPRDPFSVPALPSALLPGSPKLAWSPRLGLDVPVDPDVAEALQHAIEILRASGFELSEADPIWPEGAGEAALMPLQHAGLAARFGDLWLRDPTLFDPDVGVQIEDGLRLSATDVARAGSMSTAVAGAAARSFAGGWDFLLSPTTPCVAWSWSKLGPAEIGGVTVPHRGHAVFTPLINHAFCPAISLPAGTGRGGLPVGLQIIGPRFSDDALLALAARIEIALAAANGDTLMPR